MGFLIQGDDNRKYSARGDCPTGARVSFERVFHSGPGKRRAKNVQILDDDGASLQRLSWMRRKLNKAVADWGGSGAQPLDRM